MDASDSPAAKRPANFSAEWNAQFDCKQELKTRGLFSILKSV